MITDKQLKDREEWERFAANDYDVPDTLVLELIREVRFLREKVLQAKQYCADMNSPQGLVDILEQPFENS